MSQLDVLHFFGRHYWVNCVWYGITWLKQFNNKDCPWAVVRQQSICFLRLSPTDKPVVFKPPLCLTLKGCIFWDNTVTSQQESSGFEPVDWLGPLCVELAYSPYSSGCSSFLPRSKDMVTSPRCTSPVWAVTGLSLPMTLKDMWYSYRMDGVCIFFLRV